MESTAPRVDQLVVDLLSEIDCRFDDLTSRPDETLLSRQFAAGCLARCRSVLGSMRALRDLFPDVNGVLARNLWEAVIVGLDLLTDADALQRLGGDFQANQRRLVEANAELIDLESVIAARGIDEDRFVVKDAAERVALASVEATMRVTRCCTAASRRSVGTVSDSRVPTSI